MAMKKKALSLLVAGMVTLGTAGVVNADTTTVTGDDSKPLTSHVEVSGTVNAADGTAPNGQLSVELPTKMTFTVDQDSRLTGGNYTVTNKGKDSIDVIVSSFQRTTGDITVVENLSQDDTRDKVSLKLKTTTKEINLATVNGKTEDENKIATVAGNNGSETINLVGDAGTNNSESDPSVNGGKHVDQDGASAKFNMVFKIKKTGANI